MNNFYLKQNGILTGPFSRQQLETLSATGRLRPDDEISENKSSWLPAEQFFPELFGKTTLTNLTRLEETSAPPTPLASAPQHSQATPVSLRKNTPADTAGTPVPLRQDLGLPPTPDTPPNIPPPPPPSSLPPPPFPPIIPLPPLPPRPQQPSLLDDIAHLLGAMVSLKPRLTALSRRLPCIGSLVVLYTLLTFVSPLQLFLSSHPGLPSRLHAGCLGLIAASLTLALSLALPRLCARITQPHRPSAIAVSFCLQMNTATLFGSALTLQHGLHHPLALPRLLTLAALLLINALLAASSWQMLFTFACRLLKLSLTRCILLFATWFLILYLAFASMTTYFL